MKRSQKYKQVINKKNNSFSLHSLVLDGWFSWSGCAVGWTRPFTLTTGLQFWLFKEPQNRDFYHLGSDINSWEAKLFTSGCRSGNGKPNFSDTPKWMLECFGSAPLCLTGIHPDRAGSRLASANWQDWLFTWTHKPLPQHFKLPPKRAPPIGPYRKNNQALLCPAPFLWCVPLRCARPLAPPQ